jgi:hypothetical protein
MQANKKFKDEAADMKLQYETLRNKNKGFQIIEEAIRKELILDYKQHSDITVVLEQMLKKYRRC